MPLTTIDSVCTTLQTALGGITGIKSAPSYPTEQAPDFPFVVAYPGGGKSAVEPAGSFTALHAVLVEFHVARKNLPSDVATSLGLFEALLEMLHQTLGDNAVAHKEVKWEFSEMVWGDVQTLGYRFTIDDVKIITAIT
jgi:hypothetical protein